MLLSPDAFKLLAVIKTSTISSYMGHFHSVLLGHAPQWLAPTTLLCAMTGM